MYSYGCDVTLPQNAVAIFAMINQTNPQGFINSALAVLGTTALATATEAVIGTAIADVMGLDGALQSAVKINFN